MTSIAHLRNDSNDSTGELAAPHLLGTNGAGQPLYQGVSGWTPVDGGGEPVEVDTDEDGNMTVALAHCECAAWSGERCAWKGDRSETVLVEFMPTHLRTSHAANSGIYPHNGAQRIRCARSCADAMIESDGN